MQMKIKQYYISWKSLLRFILCVQLCLGSYPGYTSEINNNNSNNKWSNHLESLVDFLSRVGTHFEAGTLDSYLEQHSEIREYADYYSIGSQWMEVIRYDIVEEDQDNLPPDQQQVKPASVKKPRVHRTIFINDYIEHPPDIQVTDVRVRYMPSEKRLVFEGIVSDRVVLTQNIPGYDIVAYTADPELLVLMDRKKGIFLIDTSLAKEYVGSGVPIPVIPIPTKTFEDLSVLPEDLSVEFLIPDHTLMPSIISEEFQPIIGLDGEPLITAGDLIVSYKNSQGEKTLHQYINRAELYGWVEETYSILDLMMKFVAPDLMENKGQYEQFVNAIMMQEKENVEIPILGYVVSALFTKHAVRKLIGAMDGIYSRSQNLNLTNRHTLSLENWNQGVQKLKEQKSAFAELGVTEVESQEQSSQSVVDVQTSRETIRNLWFKAFRRLASVTNRSQNVITHDTTRVIGGSALVLTGGAVLFPEQYTLIMNYALHLFQYQDKGTTYAFTTLVNLLSLGLFIPAVAISLSSALPYYYKGKSKIIKFFSNFLSKDFPSEGVAQEKFEEWSDVNKRASGNSRFKRFVNLNNFVGVSLKTVAITILPVWERLANLIGQPHFFSALQRGLNPLRKVDPNSSIGQLMSSKGMELVKPTRLGTQGWIPEWKLFSRERYYQHRELQNAYETQNNTIKSIAWIMATLAVAGHEEINPEELLLYGATIHKEDRLKILSDPDLRLELDWVMLNLINHLKTIESIDWNTQLSNPEMIEQLISSYEKTQLLAERFKSQSKLGRFISRFIHSDQMKKFRHIVNARTITSWNKKQRKYLDGVPLEFVVSRAAPEAFWDNLATTAISVTYGGEDSRAELENVTALGQDSSDSFFASSAPHFNDMMQNWDAHLLVASGRTALTFMETTNRMEDAHRAAQELYKTPIPEINEYQQKFFSYLYHGLFYPLVSGGEKDNLGDVLYRQEKSRLRLIQLNLMAFIGLRYAIVDQQPFSEIVMAAAMFYFAALWIFAWPWVILQSGGKLNANHLKENEEKIQGVLTRFAQISNGVFSNEQDLRKEYQQALSDLFQLHQIQPRSSLMQKLVKTIEKFQSQRMKRLLEEIGFSNEEIQLFEQNEFVELSERKNIDDIRSVASIFVEHIAKSPPLPTKENSVSKNASIFYFGAVLSTVLALSLLVKTYETEWLTGGNLLFWTGFHILGTTIVYQLFKRGLIYDKEFDGKYRRSFKNIAIDGAIKIKNSCQKLFGKSQE